MVFKTARRVVVAVIGGTVALIGVAMIVLPGPAVVVIPLGLAILATEFAWAKRLLKRLKQQAASMFPGKRTPDATKAPAPETNS
jgi:tellurite resistance protein TerC